MHKPERPLRWLDPFKVRSVWIPPLVLVALLIVVMTLVYFGSVVNPTAHLRGLPVGGFLGAVIVNTSIDAVLGYTTTEIGPIWRQRQPVAISRWQTLLAKWAMAVGRTLVLTGLMLFTAVVILQMNAPHFASLWLLTWFAAAVIAIGTLVLFAALGTLGQLVALVVFVYLALASSGGTVPLDALSGFFRFVATFQIRQFAIERSMSSARAGCW